MRAPYASRALFFHALNALCIAFIAVYRSELYRLPASAWALSAALGFLGLFAPLSLPAGLRGRLLAGVWPLAIVLPFAGLVLTPRLFPSPLTVGPFFFCAGASFSTCIVVLWNVSRRKRPLRWSLERPDALDPSVRSGLERYFAAETTLVEESLSRWKALYRALRAQAWISTKRRRARAAAALRASADFLERSCEVERRIPLPSAAFARTDDWSASIEQTRTAFLSAAARLESGGRILRWKSWLWSLSASDLDADRDGHYVVERLARRHGVTLPASFRATGRRLGRAALTETDVAPPWRVAPLLAKPVTASVAVIVVASTFLSTATAQTPLDDSRRLPFIAGPSAESRVEPRLSRVVSSLAGRPAEVRCWSRGDWEQLAAQRASWLRRSRSRLGPWSAYVSKGRKRVNLAPNICASLTRLAGERTPVERDFWPAALAFSVATLAHEAQHVSGISNEALAECYGMQSITIAAEALGRTASEGRYLASLYWAKAYHRHRNPAYMSDECRDGGRLDLRPQVDVWP